jgi:hypothetical protein
MCSSSVEKLLLGYVFMSGFHGFPDEAEQEDDDENVAADPESNAALPLPVDESSDNEDSPFGNNLFSQTVNISDTSCVGNL